MMNTKRFFYVMVGIISMLGILSIASLVVGNSLLAKQNSKLDELKLENDVLEEQKRSVITAKANIEKYEELEKIAKQIVPQDKNQAKAVREIVKFANDAGIGLKSVVFPTASTLGKKTTPVATPPSGSSSSGSGTSTTPSTPAAPPITQVKPVSGLTGVYEMEIIVTSEEDAATFPQLIAFLRALESNRRTSQVSQMVVTPDKDNRNLLSFTITFKVYIKP